jgi:hypothetical protein
MSRAFFISSVWVSYHTPTQKGRFTYMKNKLHLLTLLLTMCVLVSVSLEASPRFENKPTIDHPVSCSANQDVLISADIDMTAMEITLLEKKSTVGATLCDIDLTHDYDFETSLSIKPDIPLNVPWVDDKQDNKAQLLEITAVLEPKTSIDNLRSDSYVSLHNSDLHTRVIGTRARERLTQSVIDETLLKQRV